MWNKYTRLLQRYPMRTQIVTSTIVWGVGDSLSQTFFPTESATGIEIRSQEENKSGSFRIPDVLAPYDINRILVASSFGGLVVGPCGHLWYQRLDILTRTTLKLAPSSFRAIATKVLLDTAIFGPALITTFLGYMTVSLGGTVSEAIHRIKSDVIPLVIVESLYWPIIQVVNFRFVPLHHQLLFVNMFSLIDSTFFCWVRANDKWASTLYSLLFGDAGNE